MIDLFSDTLRRNPYAAYDQMRSGAPVFHLAPFDLWMIFDFEGVKRALVDHDAFSSDLSHVPEHGNPGKWFIFFDPPRHTKLRALLSKAFTPRVVANLAAADPLHAGPARRGPGLTSACSEQVAAEPGAADRTMNVKPRLHDGGR